MPKTHRILTSIFLVLASILEFLGHPISSQVCHFGHQILQGLPILTLLKKLFLSIASWMAPGSTFEAPGLDFGGSGDDFSKFSTVCGFVSSKWSLHIQNTRMQRKPRTPRMPKTRKTKTQSQVGKPAKGWVMMLSVTSSN